MVVQDPTSEDPESYRRDLGPYMKGDQVYIAASWNQTSMVPSTFTIGDGSSSSGYTNVALQSNTQYGYFIRYIIENDVDPANVRLS